MIFNIILFKVQVAINAMKIILETQRFPVVHVLNVTAVEMLILVFQEIVIHPLVNACSVFIILKEIIASIVNQDISGMQSI